MTDSRSPSVRRADLGGSIVTRSSHLLLASGRRPTRPRVAESRVGIARRIGVTPADVGASHEKQARSSASKPPVPPPGASSLVRGGQFGVARGRRGRSLASALLVHAPWVRSLRCSAPPSPAPPARHDSQLGVLGAAFAGTAPLHDSRFGARAPRPTLRPPGGGGRPAGSRRRGSTRRRSGRRAGRSPRTGARCHRRRSP